MYLNEYKQKKQKMENDLIALNDMAINLNMEDLSKEINKNLNYIRQEKFQLVVVGEFSRGKSTFVNAMIGKKLLPSSKRPTTALISKIIYSDRPHFILHYKKSSVPAKKITEEEFSQLTAPKLANIVIDRVKDLFQRDKEKTLQKTLDTISYVEIGYPLQFCQNNVEVVDTPGTDDLNEGRVEITYKYLKQADGVILVLAANQPLKTSEVSFLKKHILDNQIRDIFCVLNYKDQAQGAEDRVFASVREDLLAIPGMPADLKLYLVSSIQALYYRMNQNGENLKPKQRMRLPQNFEESGFPIFERELSRYLSEEKGHGKLQKYALRGLNMIERIEQNLDSRIDFASHSTDDVEARINLLKPKIENAKAKTARIIHQMNTDFKNAEIEIVSRCDMEAGNIKRATNNAVDSYSGEYTHKNIERTIKHAINQSQEKFINDISTIQEKIFEQEMTVINHELEKLWDDLQLNYSVSQKVKVKSNQQISVNFDMGINSISSGTAIGAGLGAAIGGSIAGPVGAIVGGLVGAIFGSDDDDDSEPDYNQIKRNIKSTFNMDFEKNKKIYDEILDQYRQQASEACSQVENSVNGRLNDMVRQLDDVLEQKKKKNRKAEDVIKELQIKKRKLSGIARNLKAI